MIRKNRTKSVIRKPQIIPILFMYELKQLDSCGSCAKKYERHNDKLLLLQPGFVLVALSLLKSSY